MQRYNITSPKMILAYVISGIVLLLRVVKTVRFNIKQVVVISNSHEFEAAGHVFN